MNDIVIKHNGEVTANHPASPVNMRLLLNIENFFYSYLYFKFQIWELPCTQHFLLLHPLILVLFDWELWCIFDLHIYLKQHTIAHEKKMTAMAVYGQSSIVSSSWYYTRCTLHMLSTDSLAHFKVHCVHFRVSTSKLKWFKKSTVWLWSWHTLFKAMLKCFSFISWP